MNILLQVLDDGRLTDTKGRVVNFKNTILIMTSNLRGEELSQYLRPEFINRIDDIINFTDLGMETIKSIVDIQLNIMKKQLERQGIEIAINNDVKKYLVKNGYDPQFGARPVNRIIRRKILAGLSRYLLEHPEKEQVTVSMDENIIKFHSSTPKQQAA